VCQPLAMYVGILNKHHYDSECDCLLIQDRVLENVCI